MLEKIVGSDIHEAYQYVGATGKKKQKGKTKKEKGEMEKKTKTKKQKPVVDVESYLIT